MDMMRAVQRLLDPLIEQASFILTETRPLDGRTNRRYAFLEYQGTLDDGRIVLLGIYQLAVWRMITAEMWIPDEVRRMPPQASIESAALHRRQWTYDPFADGDVLARTIATEVSTWLRPPVPAQSDSEPSSA